MQDLREKTFRSYLRKKNHIDGTYMCIKPSADSKKKIETWLKTHNIKNAVSADDLHTTVVYSKRGIPKAKNVEVPLPIKAKITKLELFDTQMPGSGKCLVAILESEVLHKLFNHYKTAYGAEYDYDQYKPHITLSYDYGVHLPDKIPDIEIQFDSYTFEGLNPDWKESK